MTSDRLAPEDLDALFARLREGDTAARDRLVALIYDDLRQAAARMMRDVRPDHTLQPSALVNEAILRLLAGNTLRTATDLRHLYRATVQAMRQVLIDHHRHRAARKGPGRWDRHPLDETLEHMTDRRRNDFEALNEAIDRLAEVHPRACVVTTFHVFLGLPLPEVAEALEVSIKTVERDWQYARAWLHEQLAPGGS